MARRIHALNVAEKPSVAKEISKIMSNGQSTSRPGFSQYNRCFDFQYEINNQPVDMVVTSVTGHLMGVEFEPAYRSWQANDPLVLFTAPIVKKVSEDKVDIQRTLEREARGAQWLILWLDCDREGENISFEVIEACRAVNPNLRLLRARFSALIPRDIHRACRNLVEPNKADSDAVDARQEIDLRCGSAFTRWMTMRLQKRFQDLSTHKVISYGPCQFPTLGFVVKRFNEIEMFTPETFWSIEMTLNTIQDENSAKFTWTRQRIFDHNTVVVIYEMCLLEGVATITDVLKKPKSKWRPLPLTTIEMQKLAARKLRMAANHTLQIAEELYTRGLMSYPRTETDGFPDGFDLGALITIQAGGQTNWAPYAQSLLTDNKFRPPRKGSHNDQAHPPIHPTKCDHTLQGDHLRLYELVARHFLACCSDDARGQGTSVTAEIGGETFTSSGLMIEQRNYLDVYPYERWSENTIPIFSVGDELQPSRLELKEGKTAAAPLLSESDLLATMDKNGIGTDATMAEHINTIQVRGYAVKENNQFLPTTLGRALVEAYENIGLTLAQPQLRAHMEADMQRICRSTRQKQEVVTDCMNQMKDAYLKLVKNASQMDAALSVHFHARGYDSHPISQGFSKCGKCDSMMDLKMCDGLRVLSCPTCQTDTAYPLPGKPQNSVTPHPHICPLCKFQTVEITSEKGNKYHVCPFCHSSPPVDAKVNIEQIGQTFNCFHCSADCVLATKVREEPVMSCSACHSNQMALRRAPGGVFCISCQGYPACKNSIRFPAAVTELSVLTEACSRCSTPQSPVLKIMIRFSRRSVPIGTQLEMKTCVKCDEYLKELIQELGGRTSSNAPSRPVSRNLPLNNNQGATSSTTQNPRYSSYQPNRSVSDSHGPPICSICHQPGHSFNNCPNRSIHDSNQSGNPSTSGYQRYTPAEPSRQKFTCFNCGQPGHLKTNCPIPPSGGSNYVPQTTGTGNNCFNCGAPGHYAKNCPQTKKRGGDRVANDAGGKSKKPKGTRRCSKCRQPGHTKNKCPSLNN